MRMAILGLALLSAISGAPARASDALPSPGQLLDQLLGEAAAAIEEALNALPRFAPPVMDEDGNIIIRRLPPEPARKPLQPGSGQEAT